MQTACCDRESTVCNGKTSLNTGASRKAFLMEPERQIGISQVEGEESKFDCSTQEWLIETVT